MTVNKNKNEKLFLPNITHGTGEFPTADVNMYITKAANGNHRIFSVIGNS